MARTTGRSGFKLKSSPNKIFGNFFKGLGSQLKNITKKATPETKAKRAKAKKTRRAGESQYQANVRTKREERRAERKSIRLADEKYGESGIEIRG
tara:strand:+ start:93 stop:377 length:285 start_codon:yes stop_codon:yes gene_type:complete